MQLKQFFTKNKVFIHCLLFSIELKRHIQIKHQFVHITKAKTEFENCIQEIIYCCDINGNKTKSPILNTITMIF